MAARDELLAASMHASRRGEDRATRVVVISGRVEPRDALRLGAQLRRLLRSGDVELVICDVGGLVAPDAAALDAICRMRLAARRAGCGLQIRHASPELQAFLDLTGLRDVVPRAPRSGLEA